MIAGALLSKERFAVSVAASSFPQWSVRLSPTNTKARVFGQGIDYYWDAQREGERSYRERRMRLVAKRGPGKGECQLCLQCPSQIPPSFPSSSPSILSLPFLPSSWAVFIPAEKGFSDHQTETSVCAQTKNRVSLKTPYEFTPAVASLFLSHRPLCLTLTLFLSLHFLLFILQLFSLPPRLYPVYRFFFLFVHFSFPLCSFPLLFQLSLLSPVSLDLPVQS